MIKGTTPTIIFNLKDDNEQVIDLSNYTVYLSLLDSDGRIMDISNDRLKFNSDKSFECTLTQEETLSLSDGYIKVQLRAIDQSGTAIASTVAKCYLSDIIKPGEIKYVES